MDTSISTQIVPFCRSRRISFVGECFMPGKQVYAFFDGVDVNAFCEPLSSDYTNQTFSTAGAAVGAEYSTANQGKNLITSSAGKIEGIFTIPEHSQIGQENVPKFETQKELEFRLTSSPVNAKIGKRGHLSGNSTDMIQSSDSKQPSIISNLSSCFRRSVKKSLACCFALFLAI